MAEINFRLRNTKIEVVECRLEGCRLGSIVVQVRGQFTPLQRMPLVVL